MDIVRPYTHLTSMSPTERQAHIRHLNNQRQRKRYRKKKMEQLKNTNVKITTKKVNLNTYTTIPPNYDTDTDTDTDEVDDNELLVYLMENLKCNNSNDDTERLQLIDLLEDKLGVNENEKLNANGEFDKYIYSDYGSDSDSDSISD